MSYIQRKPAPSVLVTPDGYAFRVSFRENGREQEVEWYRSSGQMGEAIHAWICDARLPSQAVKA